MNNKIQEFHNYLQENFKDVDFGNHKVSKKLIIWCSVSGSLIVFVGLLLLLLLKHLPEAFAITMLLFFVGGGILLIIPGAYLININRNNKQVLAKIPTEVYEKYYNIMFPGNILKFEGLRRSDYYQNTTGMKFSIKDEFIWWDIKEHSETRVMSTGKTTTTYTVYIMNYIIRLNAQKLKNYEPIMVSVSSNISSKKKVKKKTQNHFDSSSISFNNKFNVVGSNEFQMTKLFTPKVIERFDSLVNLNQYSGRKLVIDNGFAYARYQSPERMTPYNAHINEFENLKLTKNNYCEKITQRLATEFDRFFEVLELFEPLDFYEIYY